MDDKGMTIGISATYRTYFCRSSVRNAQPLRKTRYPNAEKKVSTSPICIEREGEGGWGPERGRESEGWGEGDGVIQREMKGRWDNEREREDREREREQVTGERDSGWRKGRRGTVRHTYSVHYNHTICHPLHFTRDRSQFSASVTSLKWLSTGTEYCTSYAAYLCAIKFKSELTITSILSTVDLFILSWTPFSLFLWKVQSCLSSTGLFFTECYYPLCPATLVGVLECPIDSVVVGLT